MRPLTVLLASVLLVACASSSRAQVPVADGAALVAHEVRDDAGRLVFSAIDDDGDGLADRTWTHRYDARGRLVCSGLDTDLDGVFDSVRFADYRADGTIDEVIDLDADGVIDVYNVIAAAEPRAR